MPDAQGRATAVGDSKTELAGYGGSSVGKPASHRIDGYGIEPVAMPARCGFGNYAFIYEMMVNEHFKGQWIPASCLHFYPIDDPVRVSHHEIQIHHRTGQLSCLQAGIY